MQKIIVKFKGGSQYEVDLKNESIFITEKFIKVSPKRQDQYGDFFETFVLPVSMVEAIELC